MRGEIAHTGDKAPIPTGQRWHVERTHAWQNAFNRLRCCHERTESVVDAFFDLATSSSPYVAPSGRPGPPTDGMVAPDATHDQSPICATS